MRVKDSGMTKKRRVDSETSSNWISTTAIAYITTNMRLECNQEEKGTVILTSEYEVSNCQCLAPSHERDLLTNNGESKGNDEQQEERQSIPTCAKDCHYPRGRFE